MSAPLKVPFFKTFLRVTVLVPARDPGDRPLLSLVVSMASPSAVAIFLYTPETILALGGHHAPDQAGDVGLAARWPA